MKIKLNDNEVRRLFENLDLLPADLWRAAGQEFIKNTPRQTGNARRNTQVTDREITADYPYAAVLDQGRGFRDGQMRGSQQAPQGMTKPTIEFIERNLPGYIKRSGG